MTAPKYTYPKGVVSYSKGSFVVNQTLFFQNKFCGKSPALQVVAKRQAVNKLKMNDLRIANLKISPKGGRIKIKTKRVFSHSAVMRHVKKTIQ